MPVPTGIDVVAGLLVRPGRNRGRLSHPPRLRFGYLARLPARGRRLGRRDGYVGGRDGFFGCRRRLLVIRQNLDRRLGSGFHRTLVDVVVLVVGSDQACRPRLAHRSVALSLEPVGVVGSSSRLVVIEDGIPLVILHRARGRLESETVTGRDGVAGRPAFADPGPVVAPVRVRPSAAVPPRMWQRGGRNCCAVVEKMEAQRIDGRRGAAAVEIGVKKIRAAVAKTIRPVGSRRADGGPAVIRLGGG